MDSENQYSEDLVNYICKSVGSNIVNLETLPNLITALQEYKAKISTFLKYHAKKEINSIDTKTLQIICTVATTECNLNFHIASSNYSLSASETSLSECKSNNILFKKVKNHNQHFNLTNQNKMFKSSRLRVSNEEQSSAVSNLVHFLDNGNYYVKKEKCDNKIECLTNVKEEEYDDNDNRNPYLDFSTVEIKSENVKVEDVYNQPACHSKQYNFETSNLRCENSVAKSSKMINHNMKQFDSIKLHSSNKSEYDSCLKQEKDEYVNTNRNYIDCEFQINSSEYKNSSNFIKNPFNTLNKKLNGHKRVQFKNTFKHSNRTDCENIQQSNIENTNIKYSMQKKHTLNNSSTESITSSIETDTTHKLNKIIKTPKYIYTHDQFNGISKKSLSNIKTISDSKRKETKRNILCAINGNSNIEDDKQNVLMDETPKKCKRMEFEKCTHRAKRKYSPFNQFYRKEDQFSIKKHLNCISDIISSKIKKSSYNSKYIPKQEHNDSVENLLCNDKEFIENHNQSYGFEKQNNKRKQKKTKTKYSIQLSKYPIMIFSINKKNDGLKNVPISTEKQEAVPVVFNHVKIEELSKHIPENTNKQNKITDNIDKLHKINGNKKNVNAIFNYNYKQMHKSDRKVRKKSKVPCVKYSKHLSSINNSCYQIEHYEDLKMKLIKKDKV